MATLKCITCGSDFYARPSDIKSGRKKYCSKGCMYQSFRTIPIEKTCPICNKIFKVCSQGRTSRDYPPFYRIYCSNECSRKGRYRRGSKCNRLKSTEAAYIAGFLDADGSVMFYSRKGKTFLRVAFTNRSHRTLAWIRGKANVGNVTTAKRYSKNHQPCWHLFTNSDAASTLLEQVAPYMITKNKQAKLALEYTEQKKNPEYWADMEWHLKMKDSMQALNKRGT